jgi:hypothetical protein
VTFTGQKQSGGRFMATAVLSRAGLAGPEGLKAGLAGPKGLNPSVTRR